MTRRIPHQRYTLLAIIMVLGLIMSLAATAWAGPGWGGRMGGPMLTPEQAAKVFDLREKFLTETAGLRKQMFIKRAELQGLWRAEKPDEKAILAKKKELNALRDQLQEKAVAMGLQMRQIAPQSWGAHMGMGGLGGPHLGMGPHGGLGPGCPW